MIVTCEQCSTSFQLDESRIPATGANVRCSKCKHAFFLPNPSASQADAVHSIAEEAAEAGAAAPDASTDLNEDTWDGLNGASPVISGDTLGGSTVDPAESAAAPAAAAPPEPELDEEEWQFSEEIRTEGDDLDEDALLGGDLDAELSADLGDGFDAGLGGAEESAAGGGFDAGAFGDDGFDDMSDPAGGFEADALGADASSSALETAAPDAPQVASEAAADTGTGSGLDLGGAEPEPIGEVPGHDDSSFGSVDDFSSLMEDENGGDVTSQLASEIASELADEAGEVGTYATSGQTDDLGDPESWDLVGGDAPLAAAPSRAPSGAEDLAAELDAASADEFFSDAADYAGEAPDLAAMTQSFAAGPLGRISRIAGWAVSAVAIVFVAQLIGRAELGRWSEGPVSVSAGPISARTVESGWLRTTRTGAVLRIAGEVQNTAAQAIAPGAVQLVLLDGAGERLMAPPVGAGVPLDERVLRESDGAVLLEQAAAAARRFRRAPIAPGETRAFEVVIPEDRLPEEAMRFLLEVGEPESAPPAAAPPAQTEAPTSGESATTPMDGAPAQAPASN